MCKTFSNIFLVVSLLIKNVIAINLVIIFLPHTAISRAFCTLEFFRVLIGHQTSSSPLQWFTFFLKGTDREGKKIECNVFLWKKCLSFLYFQIWKFQKYLFSGLYRKVLYPYVRSLFIYFFSSKLQLSKDYFLYFLELFETLTLILKWS